MLRRDGRGRRRLQIVIDELLAAARSPADPYVYQLV
jgi:hypothetical protein